MKYLTSLTLYITRLTILIGIIPTVYGCQKSPINGDLDGQWQVVTVEPEVTEIILTEKLYMCFSLHVCQLSQYGGVWTTGKMEYVNNQTLYLYFPYAITYLSEAKLRQYGINKNPVTFTIEHLDKKSLILRDGDVIVTLRKF